MLDSYFQLKWESTGDQWWYATPIDWAAANGHCDLVNQLLQIDPNLLIKLTSLRRIRRLETVWDDTDPCNEVARARARVARSLLLGCEPKDDGNGNGCQLNLLIRAGYGGWLLYTAASAGDVGFVKELLERDSVAVFGEGEFGITDILYAAARSKNSEVFRLLLNSAVDEMRNYDGGCNKVVNSEVGEGFLWELMNRGVHAAARGGNLEVLKELLWDCSDVLAYKDSEGSTVLHSASARGQVEVVKDLIATHDIIYSTDNHGNTALHVAAYRGHSSVVEVLVLTAPSLGTLTNNDGDTFVHMAVAGFRSPGFHRIDQQMELMKQLVAVDSKIINLKDIVNIRNNEGRTALHTAVAENIQSNVVELLMKVPSIDLNVRDADGLTPLDLLKQWPKSADSEILVRQIASAGGVSNFQDYTARTTLVRTRGIGTSPGTSFRFPDAELFLCTGNDNESEFSSCSSTEATSHFDSASGIDFSDNNRKSRPDNSASKRLNFLLQWNRMKPSRGNEDKKLHFDKLCRNVDHTLTPLRQRYTRSSTLPNNQNATAPLIPSPSTKERFAASLMQGVIQATPPKSGFSSAQYSPVSSPFSSSCSPTSVDKHKGHVKGTSAVKSLFYSGPLSAGITRSQVDDKHRRVSSFNKTLMNQYFCFGAQGLAAEDSVTNTRASRSCRRLVF